MKRFTSILAALGIVMSAALPGVAQSSYPTVREGDFYCFPGMDRSKINYLPAAKGDNARKMMRVPKIGNSKYDNTDGHDLREVLVEGSLRIPVILVQFKDVKFSDKYDPQAMVDEMLNGDNYTYQDATGSANAYYKAMSNGKFDPKFDVYGPVTLSQNEIEYAKTDATDTFVDAASGQTVARYRAGYMVKEACEGLDDQIDFSKYDIDGDGVCDFVYLFFAGQGVTTGGAKDRTIWPHAFTISAALGESITLDGVVVNRYCCSSELGLNRKLSGIGTFCHEFGHVLGFPDLYDTANNNGRPSECFTPGAYDTMDAGNYNNDEHSPAVLSSYEQYGMEWMKPVDLTGSGTFTMLPLEAYPFAYKVATSKPQEYFMLETRGPGYYDQYLPGHGLLVWHIDFLEDVWSANVVNNVKTHQRVDIVEADNTESTSSRDGDIFPGASDVCEFTSSVTPAFKDWSNKPTGLNLTNITRNFDGTTTFNCTANSGAVQPDSEIAVVAPKITFVSENTIELEWPAVEGAEAYFISVFNMKNFNGNVLDYADYYPGYCFKKIDASEVKDGKCAFEIAGLEGNENYGIMLYAVNGVNASRMSYPLTVSTVDGSDFEAARTNLYVLSYDAGNVNMDWDAIEGADDYNLSIVTMQHGAKKDELKATFEGNKLPEGWTSQGRYESRANYYGETAPSFNFNANGSYLQTALYETPISEISFWARKRYSDDGAALEMYGADKDGNWKLISATTTLSQTGEKFTTQLPTGVYGIKLVFRFNVTQLYGYIDDVTLVFNEEEVETPVAGAVVEKLGNTAVVKGLSRGVEYAAYVTPVKDGTEGARSHVVKFFVDNLPSGIEDVTISDNDATAFVTEGMTVKALNPAALFNVYNVDGTALAVGAKGSFTLPARGIYLLSSGGKTVKIIL